MLHSAFLLAVLVVCDVSAAPLVLNENRSILKQESNTNSTEPLTSKSPNKILKPTKTIMFGALVPHRTFFPRRFQKAISAVIDDLRNYPRLSLLRFNHSSDVNYKVDFHIVNIKHNPSPKDILRNLCEEFLAYNVTTILYTTNFETYGSSTASAQYFLQLAAYVGIPVIGWHADNSGLERPASQSTLQLQLAPSLEHQTIAMLSILQRYKWHQFSIVTSQIAGHDDFIQAVREKVLHSQYKLRIIDTVIVSVLTDLNRLVESETRIMLLYSTRMEARHILSHASKLKLTGVNYLWLATQSVLGSSKDAPVEFPTGMLGVHFGTDDDSLLEWLSKSTRVFLHGLEHYLSAGSPASMIPSVSCQVNGSVRWTHGELFYRHLRNVTLIHNATGQPVLQFSSDGRSRVTELQIMNLRPATTPGLLIWEEVGLWKSWLKEGLDIKDIVWPGNSHTPPQGLPEKFHLKITFLEEPPYINVAPPDEMGHCGLNKGVPCRIRSISDEAADSGRNGSIFQCCSGFCIDLLEKFADDLAFTYELFRVEDGKWGAKTNEKWNGLVAALINDKADMVMTSLKINFERSQAIDFSLPFLDTGIAIVVAKRTGIISPTAFLEPFDSSMWMLVALVAIHVAAITIFLFEWLSPYGFDAQVKPSEHRFSLCRTLWLVWAVLFQAAVNVDCPRGYTARFVANVWAMFALIFLAIYTANLAAFMITREEFHHLTGINDTKLSNPHTLKPPFRFGTIPHGNTDAVLRRNFPLMHDYMRRYTKNNVIAGVQAVKQGFLDAFIYDATVLDYLVGQDSECVLLTVGSWFAMTGYGVGFPRNSKYKALINQQLMEYRENGDLERLQRFWFSGACNKPASKEKQSRSDPLALEQFFSTFLLLGSGILLSVILLLMEHIYWKYIMKIRCRRSGVPIQLIRASNCCSLISRSVGSTLRPRLIRKNKVYSKNTLYASRECHTALNQLREALSVAQSRVNQLEAEVAINEGIIPRPEDSCMLHGSHRLSAGSGWRWLPQTRISPRSSEFFSASCDELYNSHHGNIRRHQIGLGINEIAEIETVL